MCVDPELGRASYVVVSAEAPGTTTWDLTRQDLKLHLSFTGAPTTPAGSFGSPNRFRNPVVYLCGEADADIIRYVPVFSQALGVDGGVGVTLNSTFVLSGDPRWVVGRGSGFDTARVRRIEVLLHAAGPFTITFDANMGFIR